ncbi:MAG: hypothetical protein J5501_05645 [Ruminococcus sp.]|nr:hypothetical protein [Ruminococcus sp.]
MKNVKAIVAALSAAVMCALPAANAFTADAYAQSGARFTFRKNFAVSSAKNIDHLVFGVKCATAHTDGPKASKIASGTLTPGAGGNAGVHNAGGTFYPSNRNMVGGMVSVAMVCDSPYDYVEKGVTNYAYDANNKLIKDAVGAGPTFLVGDLDLDKDIDAKDYDILFAGVKKVAPYSWSKYKFSYFGYMNVAVGGVGRNYSFYSFDINDDGYLSQDDLDMFQSYNSGNLKRFPK